MNVVPPQGFDYLDGNTILKAATKELLIKEISRYRIETGRPLGDPAKDLEEYLQHKKDIRLGLLPEVHPYLPARVAEKTLADRISNWTANRYSKAHERIDYVTQDEAERRASICKKCPQNIDWKKTSSCAPCVDNTSRTLLMLRRGQKTGRGLGGCGIAGHDNEVACFLPASLLQHSRKYKDKLPDFCWLLEEAANGWYYTRQRSHSESY